MLANVFALALKPAQIVHQFGRVHKTEVDALPCQRMDGVRGITDQRQTMRGKLASIAARQRKNLPFAFQAA
ncbi:Uncharacterised protein [Acinetobacter baumannii]|nr:Uncharacterised protein [Acinetobacter baumannii]